MLTIALLILVGLSHCRAVIHRVDKKTDAAPHQEPSEDLSVLLVALRAGDGARLMTEAALVLADHDFQCTLVLVSSAVDHIEPVIPRSKPGLKVHVVRARSGGTTADADCNKAGHEEGGLAALQPCEVRAHLKACELLMNDKTLMASLRTSLPRLLLFPGFLHDACLLPALAGPRTAAVVWSSDAVAAAWLGHVTGAVPFSAHHLVHLQSRPTASSLDRLTSVLQREAFLRDVEEHYWRPAAALAAQSFGGAEMSVREAYSRVSLLLSASHGLLEAPAPALAMRINVGCFHCRHAQPLPHELREWVATRRGGLMVATLPDDAAHQTLVRAVSLALPQFAVLWLTPETDSDSPRPANLVQHGTCNEQDALGHPRARLVLSTCSEPGVLAAVFHGVPLLCVVPPQQPEALQQAAVRASQLGVALTVRLPDLEAFLSAAQILTTNTTFRHGASHLGVMLRDEPETSADRLVFWLGHTARHWGHGHEDALRAAREAPRDTATLLIEAAAPLLALLVGVVGVGVGLVLTLLGTCLCLGLPFFLCLCFLCTRARKKLNSAASTAPQRNKQE